MQIELEQAIAVVACIIAALGFLYAVWPLLEKGAEFLKLRQPTEANRYDPTLTPYEQLVKLLNNDLQLVSLLLQKLSYQIPHQPDDWYCKVAFKQMQLWIVNKLSDDRNDPEFGERQATRYLSKYRDRPQWWVYRKLAIDHGLFQKGSPMVREVEQPFTER